MNSSSSVASRLQPLQRQEIAVKVLSKQEPITQIAHQEQVSRKFIYQQKALAQEALNTAFDKPEKEQEILYYLPVTQQWIFQLILATYSVSFKSRLRPSIIELIPSPGLDLD